MNELYMNVWKTKVSVWGLVASKASAIAVFHTHSAKALLAQRAFLYVWKKCMAHGIMILAHISYTLSCFPFFSLKQASMKISFTFISRVINNMLLEVATHRKATDHDKNHANILYIHELKFIQSVSLFDLNWSSSKQTLWLVQMLIWFWQGGKFNLTD